MSAITRTLAGFIRIKFVYLSFLPSFAFSILFIAQTKTQFIELLAHQLQFLAQLALTRLTFRFHKRNPKLAITQLIDSNMRNKIRLPYCERAGALVLFALAATRHEYSKCKQMSARQRAVRFHSARAARANERDERRRCSIAVACVAAVVGVAHARAVAGLLAAHLLNDAHNETNFNFQNLIHPFFTHNLHQRW